MLFLLPLSLADVATDGREAGAGALLAPLEQAAPVASTLGRQQADACRFLAILADSIESGGRAAAESAPVGRSKGLVFTGRTALMSATTGMLYSKLAELDLWRCGRVCATLARIGLRGLHEGL